MRKTGQVEEKIKGDWGTRLRSEMRETAWGTRVRRESGELG